MWKSARFVTRVLALVLVVVVTPFLVAPTRALDNNRAYRKAITLDHTRVGADLTDFPVLVSINADADLAARARQDGDDILFADELGNLLDYEIESFDGDSGALVAWVRVPSLSASVDTVFYMHYGNADAASEENPEGVWDAGYVMVQHLEETSGTHLDGTANGNDGVPVDGVVQDVAGQIDGADGFDGLDDHLQVADASSLATIATIELWLSPDVTYDSGYGSGGSEYDGPISKRADSGEYEGFAWFFYGGTTAGKRGKMQLTSDPGAAGTGIIVTNNNLWEAGTWYHVVAVLDGVSGKVYVNGVDDTDTSETNATGSALAQSSEPLVIGKHVSSYINFFEGRIDEVRLSSAPRSADWILTSYNNQSSPSTFIRTAPPPVVTLEGPADGATATAPVTFSYTPECSAAGGCASADLFVEDTVYSGEGTLEWNNASLVRMDRALVRDNVVYAIHWPTTEPQPCSIVLFDFLTGALIQESDAFGEDNSSTAPTLDPEDPHIVYGVSGDGVAVRYNWYTDTIEWETDIGQTSDLVFWPSFVPYYDGYLYLAFRNYYLYQVRASDGEILNSIELHGTGNEVQIPPRVDEEEGVLYVQDATHLLKLDATDLSEIWAIPIGSGCLDVLSGSRFVPLLVQDSFTGDEKWIVTHCAADRTLFAFDAEGNQEWTRTLDRPIRAPASYHPDRGWIYLNSYATSNGEIYVLDIADGLDVFTIAYPNGYPSYRPVMLTKDYLISKTDRGGATDYLYVFDNLTGDVIGTVDIGTQVYHCDPLITSGGYTLITHAYDQGVRLYKLGAGEFGDYTRYTGDNGYQYTENGLTDYGQPSLVWTWKKSNEVPVVSGELNSITFDFAEYALPQTLNWNIRVTDAVGSSSFAAAARQVTVSAPTAVTLASFSAEPLRGRIALQWETAIEIDTLGFHLYRSESLAGPRLRLNGELIPSQMPGGVAGALYTWLDETVAPGAAYYYWLEDVDLHGLATLHGPVSAAASAEPAFRLYLPLAVKR